MENLKRHHRSMRLLEERTDYIDEWVILQLYRRCTRDTYLIH
jgi:hypothetical protein